MEEKNNEKGVFSFPAFIFQDLDQKKNDGRVGAGKPKDADNIGSVFQSVAVVAVWNCDRHISVGTHIEWCAFKHFSCLV